MEFQPMSPEEIERTVQFLLRQQAQFASDLDNLASKTDRVTDALVALTGIVGRLAEALERTDARVRDLAEEGRRTDANLDALIHMFERHLREDHRTPPS